MVAEARQRWETFASAFEALGGETRGMLPSAAAVLLDAALDFTKNPESGYQPYSAGVPSYAITGDVKIVDLRTAYSGCSEFWEFDDNNQRAKISRFGVDYVNRYINVFSLLLEELS